MHTHTIIDPLDQLADDDRFGQGRPLEGGGYAYDLSLTDDERDALPTDVEVYHRQPGETMRAIVESAGYSIETTTL